MKKYSSYADLKLNPYIKPTPFQTRSPKTINSPSFRKALAVDHPVMFLSKDSFPIPTTTKYSAGYIQRKKIFSNKKDLKENQTININQNQNMASKEKLSKKQTSKIKKVVKKESSCCKKPANIEIRQELVKSKQDRMDVQSPKGNITSGNNKFFVDSKQKLKTKDSRQKKDNKENTKPKKTKSNPLGLSGNQLTLKPAVKRQVEKKQAEQLLDELVTKYDQQPKGVLAQCTSDSNLLKGFSSDKSCKGYYVATIYSSFFSTKVSSFHQICKNHLTTSIDFLTYARKTKNFIPKKCEMMVSLPQTKRKTIIFDLDETLIHCNESIDIPNDIVLDIAFPNNTSIKAGINIRPYAIECLKQLSEHFELIVFTASHQCYANVIIDYLDPQRKYISHRLFRNHCYKTSEGFYVKDLRILNRNLSSTLLIDNAAYSYCFQPENGVPIIPFYNNKTDWELKEVTEYLLDFKEVKNMRIKNENCMRLSEYYRFKSPRELINQLYM